MATGLILLVVGEARAKQNMFMAERKTYEGVIRFGMATTTDDLDKVPIDKAYPRKPEEITREELEQALSAFRGPIKQEVPTFSAVKWKGKPLYHWDSSSANQRGSGARLGHRGLYPARFHLSCGLFQRFLCPLPRPGPGRKAGRGGNPGRPDTRHHRIL